MLTYPTPKTEKLTFDSLTDFVTHTLAIDAPKTKSSAFQKRSAAFNSHGSFTGAVDAVRAGWQPVFDNMPEDVNFTLDAVRGDAPEYRYDVTGDVLNVPRAIAGRPDPFMSEVNAEGPARIVKIGIVFSINADTSPEKIIRRGGLIAAIIERLEGQGIETELVMLAGTRGRRDYKQLIEVTLKRAGQPLDLELMLTAVGMPDMERRLLFRQVEGSKFSRRLGAYDGYGSAIFARDFDTDDFNIVFDCRARDLAKFDKPISPALVDEYIDLIKSQTTETNQ